MPSDPDHVLDAIDGVVDEWLAMSEDSMRWAPPEKAPPRPRLALPAPPLPHISDDFLREVGVLFGTQTQAAVETVVEALRPLGEGLAGAVTAFLDSPAVRQLIELADPPEDHAFLDFAERGDSRPELPAPRPAEDPDDRTP
ncbi:hypothetical protein ACQPYK_18800 [Streptosporangium sp. CA-135522]|uniref:hypothetical protein n=1 Tax=Streptosporangium sp. CA-135522 TaxID=3240072 RepID=UPI003D9421E5